jgi:hypothetical protein
MEQHITIRRLPDSGQYSTGHGWHKGNLGDFDGDRVANRWQDQRQSRFAETRWRIGR